MFLGWRMLLLATFIMLLPLPAQAAETVDNVSVHVEAAEGLPPLIQQRMQASVKTIAEQLVVGSSLGRVAAAKAEYENIIHQVFDKILVGYSVAEVRLVPGTDTQVFVRLMPWSEIIQKVELSIVVDGLPAEIGTLALQDLEGVDRVFCQSLQGLPVDATDWSNGVLKRSLNEFMEAHLPEFRADFDLEPGSVAKVKLVVYPRGPVVRTVDLQMRSDTVPNLMLLEYRQKMQDQANSMLGVPVAFVSRHAAYFQGRVKAAIDETPNFKFFKLQSVIDLQPGEQAVVVSRSNTSKYRLRVEGRIDMGRGQSNTDGSTSFVGLVGVMLSPQDQLFTQVEFYPQAVKAIWYGGYSRSIGNGNEVFGKYNFSSNNYVVGADRQFDDRWKLRYEYAHDTGLGEWGLRYKLHDFVGLEYIVNHEDRWLRLIGNF